MAGIEHDWSRISEDLLFSIVKLLPSRIDILRLRAVCRSFRATIPLPPLQYPFPNSILTNTNFLKGPDHPEKKDVVTLTGSTVYAIEPLKRISGTQDEETPQPWVVKVTESNSGSVRVVDPITDEDCKNLSEKLPKSFNVLDYRVTEICKFYEFDLAIGYNTSKVVFSSSLDEHDDEFAVVAIYDLRELAIWRNVDKKWSYIDLGPESDECFEDIIYYNDKFYVLELEGRIFTVDPKSLSVTEVVAADRAYYLNLSLVSSSNDLFLLSRYDVDDDNDGVDKHYIEVFKLNEEKTKWVQVVDGLDLVDRVFFVDARGKAFSVSVKEFPGFKGGCAYSSDGERIWILEFYDGKFGPISGFSGYSNILWPPPAWLKFGDLNLLDVNPLEKMNMIKKDKVGNWEAAEPSDRQGKRLKAEAGSSHVEDQLQIITTKLDSLTSQIQDSLQTVYNRLDHIESRLNTLTNDQEALRASFFHPPPSTEPRILNLHVLIFHVLSCSFCSFCLISFLTFFF